MTEILTKPILKGSKKARNSSARLTAVQCWYQVQQTGQTYQEVIDDYVQNRMGREVEGELYVAANTDLLKDILSSVQDNSSKITDIIEAQKNTKENQSDFDLVLKGILVCGLAEFLSGTSVDAPIIINDYVNVTKAFYEGKEPTLVNSMLDRISKTL